MEINIGFPELGSRFETISVDKESVACPGQHIRMVATVKVKVVVSKLDAIFVPHELVLIHQEDFDPDSSFAEVQARAKECADTAIAALKAPD